MTEWMTDNESGDDPWLREVVSAVLETNLPPLPPHSQRIGNSTVEWWEPNPGEVIIMASEGSVDDRTLAEQIVKGDLAAHGYERVAFVVEGWSDEELDLTLPHLTAQHHSLAYLTPPYEAEFSRREAKWSDIAEKAQRLMASGNVTLLRNGFNSVVAHVIGDHGEYNCEIGRDSPDSRAITTWTCECPWDQYAWGRTRQWKKYEGRPCAHVMAALWTSMQTPLDEQLSEQQAENMPPGQAIGPGAGTPLPPSGAPPMTGMPQSYDQDGNVLHGDQMSLFTGQPELGGPSPLGPPSPADVLPPFPGAPPEQMQLPIPGATPAGVPAPPNSVSVPGARPPSPFNPMQWPGGTYSSAPEEPPNYRKRSGKKHCGDCKMFDRGKCWGYGNKKVGEDMVCDSFYPDPSKAGEFPAFKTAAQGQFEPGQQVNLTEDVYGLAPSTEVHGDDQYHLVPTGTGGEVLSQDPTTGWIEAHFPLEGGVNTPHGVRVFLEPRQIKPSTRTPGSTYFPRNRS